MYYNTEINGTSYPVKNEDFDDEITITEEKIYDPNEYTQALVNNSILPAAIETKRTSTREPKFKKFLDYDTSVRRYNKRKRKETHSVLRDDVEPESPELRYEEELVNSSYELPLIELVPMESQPRKPKQAVKKQVRKKRKKVKQKKSNSTAPMQQKTKLTKQLVPISISKPIAIPVATPVPNSATSHRPKKPKLMENFIKIPLTGGNWCPETSLVKAQEHASQLKKSTTMDFVMPVDIKEILQKKTEEIEPDREEESDDVLLGIGVVDSDVEVVDEFPVSIPVVTAASNEKVKAKINKKRE